MEPLCSWSEANWILSISRKGKCDTALCTGVTVERKEHRLSKPKTKIEQGVLLLQLLRLSPVATPRK